MAKHVICDVEKRFIFLNGDIFFITFTLIENYLKELTAIDANRLVNFYINSTGGDFYASLQICHLLRRVPVTINTIAVDFAKSGGLLILQTGEKRFSTNETSLGFHMAKVTKDSIENIFKTTDNDVNSRILMELAQELFLIDAQQMIILGERGRPISKIKKLFSRNAEITAQQALKLNLIDGILPKSKIPKI